MSWLFPKAYLELLRWERYLASDDFAGLYERVRHMPVASYSAPENRVIDICSAVDWACVWYWKQVLCLQRSAATTCLLRRYGLPAQFVIGAQHMPFRAHAWVELSGEVVNDKPYRIENYRVLERC